MSVTPLEVRLNPFERIRSTEGKVFLLLSGLVLLTSLLHLLTPYVQWAGWPVLHMTAVFAYMLIATYGPMRIVARPVRRATAHFEAIAAGDYTRPVRTRRTDEFGDMLRGLEQMRGSLATAIAARDAAEQRYREILERSVQGFYQSTEEGDLLAANDALARLLGYESPDALLAEPAGITKRLHVDPARRLEFLHQMRSFGAVRGFEAALRRRDGSTLWVSENARVVHDRTSGHVYWEGFLDDISERKAAEQLKSDFVSFVTHQLRTPLSGIRWMLELANEAATADEVQSFIADAHASAQRLICLVNDLLDVTRLEDGRLLTDPQQQNVLDVALALRAELDPLARAKNQTLVVAGSAAHVVVDAQLLRQSLLNLMANAIKYTPAGGTVEVRVQQDAGEVRVSVRDTGIGIPEHAQRQLFEKFFRADNAQVIDTEGTGLGLYLVKLFADQSGGRVSCHSVQGLGSTFTLSLPSTTPERHIA